MSAALKEIEFALTAVDARLEQHQGKLVVVGAPGRLTPEALSRIRTLVSALPPHEQAAAPTAPRVQTNEPPSRRGRALSAPRWMSTHAHLRACFTPAGLGLLRPRPGEPEPAYESSDLLRVAPGVERVAIDDPGEWELWGEYPGGDILDHVWEHRRTTWLSHSLRVPRWMLEEPDAARHALRRCEGARQVGRHVPSELEAVTVRHVAEVERRPRYKLKRADPACRLCSVCGARPLADGPLPWLWDCHPSGAADSLLLTCGPACRAAKGFAERRATHRREKPHAHTEPS